MSRLPHRSAAAVSRHRLSDPPAAACHVAVVPACLRAAVPLLRAVVAHTVTAAQAATAASSVGPDGAAGAAAPAAGLASLGYMATVCSAVYPRAALHLLAALAKQAEAATRRERSSMGSISSDPCGPDGAASLSPTVLSDAALVLARRAELATSLLARCAHAGLAAPAWFGVHEVVASARDATAFLTRTDRAAEAARVWGRASAAVAAATGGAGLSPLRSKGGRALHGVHAAGFVAVHVQRIIADVHASTRALAPAWFLHRLRNGETLRSLAAAFVSGTAQLPNPLCPLFAGDAAAKLPPRALSLHDASVTVLLPQVPFPAVPPDYGASALPPAGALLLHLHPAWPCVGSDVDAEREFVVFAHPAPGVTARSALEADLQAEGGNPSCPRTVAPAVLRLSLRTLCSAVPWPAAVSMARLLAAHTVPLPVACAEVLGSSCERLFTLCSALGLPVPVQLARDSRDVGEQADGDASVTAVHAAVHAPGWAAACQAPPGQSGALVGLACGAGLRDRTGLLWALLQHEGGWLDAAGSDVIGASSREEGMPSAGTMGAATPHSPSSSLHDLSLPPPSPTVSATRSTTARLVSPLSGPAVPGPGGALVAPAAGQASPPARAAMQRKLTQHALPKGGSLAEHSRTTAMLEVAARNRVVSRARVGSAEDVGSVSGGAGGVSARAVSAAATAVDYSGLRDGAPADRDHAPVELSAATTALWCALESVLDAGAQSVAGPARAQLLVAYHRMWREDMHRKMRTELKKAHIREVSRRRQEGQPAPQPPDYDAVLRTGHDPAVVLVGRKLHTLLALVDAVVEWHEELVRRANEALRGQSAEQCLGTSSLRAGALQQRHLLQQVLRVAWLRDAATVWAPL